MNDGILNSSLVLALFGVAAVHALLPTHWLSFVLVAKAQKWSRKKMLEVVLFSGLGHVTTTTLVGLAAAALGKTVHKYIGNLDTPLPALILAAFGLYYLVMGWRREGHRHCVHDHAEDPIQVDRIAAGALFLEMTLSPCETLIPIFFAAGSFPWPTLILMAIVSSAITILAMVLLSFLGYTGYHMITFPWLEHNERLVLGVLLIGLGGVGYFFH